MCDAGPCCTCHVSTPLSPARRFGSKFSFEPERGTLAPGAMAQIKTRLCSDALGAFEESFNWYLAGRSEQVTLTIKGCVIGPTFSLDTKELEFGLVSFGFRCMAGLGSGAALSQLLAAWARPFRAGAGHTCCACPGACPSCCRPARTPSSPVPSLPAQVHQADNADQHKRDPAGVHLAT